MAIRGSGLDIQIEIDETQLKHVIQQLEKAKTNVQTALRNVLNRVARDARKQMVQRARAQYVFKPRFKIGNIELTPASAGNLQAKLKSQNRPRTAKQYNMRALKRGVKLGVLKSRAPVFLGEQGRRAFVGPNGLVMQRQGAARMPLRVPHGPSEANMYKGAWEGKHGGGPMQSLVESRLARELYVELDKHL